MARESQGTKEKWLPVRPVDPCWTLDQARAVASAFDPRNLPRSFYDNPFPTYRALLAHDPVHQCNDGSWFLTRHADLDRIYRDTTSFSSDKRAEFKPKYGDSPLLAHHTTSLVFNDPPLHTRVRKRIVGALTPRAIEHMKAGLIALVDQLLDELEAKGDVDLIGDFAAAIPIEIIGNLLNIPRGERGPLRDWSLAILGALEPTLTQEQSDRGNKAVSDFIEYLDRLVAERRKNPGDPKFDVLTSLIGDARGDGHLGESELLHNCIFILNAGHETTTNLIGNGLHSLIEWPGQRQRLIDDPQLIEPAVEEFLRYESSNQLGNRRTTCEVTFVDHRLPAGSLITLCIGAANRDPAQFPDPDRLDISRKPNAHLAFAGGAHLCAGLSLARLEGRVAISRFVKRFPDYGLIGAPVRSGRVRFRGFQALPARVTK